MLITPSNTLIPRYHIVKETQTRICTEDNENGKRNHVIIEIDLEIEVFILRKKKKSGKWNILGSTTRNAIIMK